MTTGIQAAEADFLRALSARVGISRGIVSIDRRRSALHSSFALDEVSVALDDGTTRQFIAKAADWSGLSPEGQRAKPRFVWNAERERSVYESILPAFAAGSAEYCGSFTSSSGIRYMLLEHLPGAPLWQFGDRAAWEEAAKWLARLHGSLRAEAAAGTAASTHLLRYDRQFYECWMHRARAFRIRGDRALAVLARIYPRVVDRLLDLPAAFIHGEFYASNVLVARSGETFTVRAIDWEMAALGPVPMDLACLVAGRWTDDERAGIADVYYEQRALEGAEILPRDEYLQILDCCLIHLSVRNLGWSRDWSPPPDREYHWLGEALRLCDKWNF